MGEMVISLRALSFKHIIREERERRGKIFQPLLSPKELQQQHPMVGRKTLPNGGTDAPAAYLRQQQQTAPCKGGCSYHPCFTGKTLSLRRTES